jgi:hypothetical protein
MSSDHSTGHSPADGSSSRPSQTNRHGPAHPAETSETKIEPSDMGATGLRPLSVDGEAQLRDEALAVDLEDEAGGTVPLTSPNVTVEDGRVKSRPWYRVVNLHSQWYEEYRQSHIEFENPDGETVRAPLRNSYQPEYGDKYYARLMDLKRGVERRWDDFSIVMLTLSASTLNANGQPRCPADHMREIADGWKVARKHLYDVLENRNWVYGRVWEPTSSDGHGPAGYGHMHVAVFVEDGDGITGGEFRPFMESYVSNTPPAGWDAHRPDGDAVSVTHDLEDANAATYISEYIGQYGEELVDRPMHERAFLAVAWATGTRRVDFSNAAQEIIRGEEFRRETGLRPEDRGSAGTAESGESDTHGDRGDEDGDGDGWEFKQLCEVSGREPEFYQPAGGGVDMTQLDGVGSDPPRDVGPPPG